MTTRQAGKEALQHVLENILLMDKNSPIGQALSDSGYQDPYSVVTMLDMDIKQLAYIDANGSLVPLMRFHHGLLKTFRDWVKHLDSIGNPINDK